MIDFPFIPVCFAICAVLVLTVTFCSSMQPLPRKLASLAISLLIGAYLVWRIPQLPRLPIEFTAESVWIWLFVVVEFASLLDLLAHVLLMSRFTDRVPEADEHERHLRSLPPDELPEVDVWIATYNEEWSILEKSLVGCQHLDWPKGKLKIWVLDDGRRDWLRDRCEDIGVGYIRRADNKGKKAGNHNNALKVTSAPYILSLDADFVPFPKMLYRVIGFFEERNVAIVQTPQCYYNPEPMRRNLALEKVVPDELDMFYKVLQPARDAWGAAFYVGSAAVLRRKALEHIGGFETTTDIEDQVTAIKLIAHGWCTRFLGEGLSVGLAPESSAALHDQRNRWCRGSLQILFLKYGPFGRGLSLIHRIFFLQTFWILGSVGPLVFTFTPVLIWLFGWRLFPVIQHEQVILLPIVLFVAICSYLTWVAQRTWLPILSPAFHLFMAVELLPTALTTLIKPFGKSLIKILPVTIKGSDAAGGGGVDARTFGVLGVMLLLLIGGMGYACATSRSLLDHPLEIAALMTWSCYSFLVLAVALRCCLEPAINNDFWFTVDRKVEIMDASGIVRDLRISEISLSGARSMEIDQGVIPGPVRVRIDSRVIVDAVFDPAADDTFVFGELDVAVRRELTRLLFATPEIHAKPAFYALPPVIKTLAYRLLIT